MPSLLYRVSYVIIGVQRVCRKAPAGVGVDEAIRRVCRPLNLSEAVGLRTEEICKRIGTGGTVRIHSQ
jgi:hypothetical protein